MKNRIQWKEQYTKLWSEKNNFRDKLQQQWQGINCDHIINHAFLKFSRDEEFNVLEVI